MPSASSSMPKLPTARPVSWPAVILKVVVFVSAIGTGWLITRDSNGVALGAGAYLVYSFGSRKLFLGDHRRGMQHIQQREFEEAIPDFKAGYSFFTRHSWLDRYRAITVLSPSAMSYREMALLNIAFAYGQLGEGAKSKEYYLRAKE